VKGILVLAALLGPAACAGAVAGEYYIVEDVAKKRCGIVESPPATTELVLVENGQVHFDKDEAERAMASLARCTSPNSTAPAKAGSRPTHAQAQASPKAKPKRKVAARKPPAGETAQQPQAASPRGISLSSFLTLFR
jgi:hypothetical protein